MAGILLTGYFLTLPTKIDGIPRCGPDRKGVCEVLGFQAPRLSVLSAKDSRLMFPAHLLHADLTFGDKCPVKWNQLPILLLLSLCLTVILKVGQK